MAGALGASALIPQEGYARETAGMGIDGGVWLQAGHLVIEPRASLRFDVTNKDRDYIHLVPLEVGAYWLGTFEQNAIYLGPGFSFQHVTEEVELERTIGSELMATSERTALEFQFAAGVFARAGVIFARSSAVSTALSVDYALTFVDFEKTSLMRAVRLNIGLLFGRGR